MRGMRHTVTATSIGALLVKLASSSSASCLGRPRTFGRTRLDQDIISPGMAGGIT